MRRLLTRLFRPASLPDSALRGIRGERLARRHLRRKRYRILARNLDFLMRHYQPAPMAGPQREHE